MNTLKIFLKESGSTAEVNIDFRLYRNAYRTSQIDIYVPSSLISTQEDVITDVKTAGLLTNTNGQTITTQPFRATYNRDEEVNGVNYKVYRQDMPSAYLIYAGQQTIICNVISISGGVVETLVTTQEVVVEVLNSAYVEDEPLYPTQYEEIWAEINDILENKEDKVDENIVVNPNGTITSQRVATAINELDAQVTENTGDISSQGSSISDLSERVSDLENTIAREENFVGEMNLIALPTDAQVTAFVVSTISRQPRNGDVVIVTVNDDGIITTYKYLYTNSGWIHYQIEYSSKAENDVAGLVEGTYGIDGYNQPISANIVNGQIINLYHKNNSNTYSQVSTSINTNTGNIANIIDGTQIVGEAVKATEDENGDNIASTYAKANNVYTKSQSDMKYLPKTYTNVYYYATDGLVDSVPTTPADGVQFSVNVPISGEVQLASCGRVLTANYHFTKNSTDESRIWLLTDENTTLQIRLLTYVTFNGQSELLASQLTSDIEFVANEPKEIILDSIYNNLGNIELDVEAGETFRKEIYVTSVDNTASTVELVSSIQYASSFNLSVQSISFDVNTISGIKTINILSSQWTQNLDGTYSITILQTQHGQAPTNKYFLSLQEEVANNTYDYIAFTPQVDTDGNITITSDYALDCQLLIASATQSNARGILTVTNPTSLPTIDYEQSGALRIVQNETATDLTLNSPEDTGKFYTFFVSNDNASTETISVNGVIIEVGSGVQFKWVGQWQSGITPTDTSEIYDSVNSQPLNTTITNLQNNKQNILTLANVNTGNLAEQIGFNASGNLVRQTKKYIHRISLGYNLGAELVYISCIVINSQSVPYTTYNEFEASSFDFVSGYVDGGSGLRSVLIGLYPTDPATSLYYSYLTITNGQLDITTNSINEVHSFTDEVLL